MPGVGAAGLDLGGDRGGGGLVLGERPGRNLRARERRALCLRVGEAAFEPGAAVAEVAPLAFEGRAAGLAGGAGLGHLEEAVFGDAELGAGFVEPGGRRFDRAVIGALGVVEHAALVGEAGEGGVAIGQMAHLAVEIGPDLLEPALGLGARGDGAGELLFEALTGMGDALHGGRRRGLGEAQRGQFCLGRLALALREEGALGGGRDIALGLAQGPGGGGRFGLAGVPARVEHLRLGAADLLAEPAIALGLFRLLVEPLELRRHRRDHVVEAEEVVLGPLQFELGLVAALVQPGGAGGLVEQHSPL